MKTAITFIIVFSVLVLIHEFGHFIVAKWSGVIVHEFSLGIGPKIIGYQGKETYYSLRIFPIGGYVRMEGDEEESDSEGAFNNKSIWKRLAIVFAGPVMNFVLAFFIILILFTYEGIPVNQIGGFVENDSPAYKAGLQVGDTIVKIDDMQINSWNDITDAVAFAKDDILEIDVIRKDKSNVHFTVEAKINEQAQRRLMGIYPEYVHNIGIAAKESLFAIFMIIKLMLGFLGSLLVGKGDFSQVSGAVGVYQAVGEASRAGVMVILDLTAMLSINLGIVNLLPFPALDGGRIMFMLIELIRGKPVSQEKEGFVHLVGFVILMSLMVLLVFKDLNLVG